MCHGGRKSNYLMLGAGAVAIALVWAFDVSPAIVLLLAICPLMMFLMMRSMAGSHNAEDHRGHGCEHDPTRHESPTEQHSER